MYAAITHLRDRARALDETADHMAHRVGTIGWQGAAAEAMRSRAASAVADLRRCARLHDEAAQALERHRQAALAHPLGLAAYEATSLMDSAVSGLGSALGSLL